jgi:hypothetical protein
LPLLTPEVGKDDGIGPKVLETQRVLPEVWSTAKESELELGK